MEWPTDYDYALDMTVQEAIELEYYSRGTYPVVVDGDELTVSYGNGRARRSHEKVSIRS